MKNEPHKKIFIFVFKIRFIYYCSGKNNVLFIYWFTNISQNIRNMDLNFKLILFDCMLVNHRMRDSKIYYITLYSLMTQI